MKLAQCRGTTFIGFLLLFKFLPIQLKGYWSISLKNEASTTRKMRGSCGKTSVVLDSSVCLLLHLNMIDIFKTRFTVDVIISGTQGIK